MDGSNSSSSSTPRDKRGLALFLEKGSTIKALVAAKYFVPSASGAGGFVVDAEAGSCTCPDWQALGAHGRPHRCKHIVATLYVRRETQLPDGNAVVTETKKPLYQRDWRATNATRTAFPRLGPSLLAELINGLPIPDPPAKRKRGRPAVPMKMVLLAAGLRAMEDMTAGAAVVAAENYRELGVVTMSVIPSFNTLLREFANPKYMPWLHRMIAASAAPLIVLEDKFACDGTGFGSSVYDCHNDEKHGSSTQRRKPTKRHRWVHGHIAFGVRTHVIAAVQITEKNVAESPLMPELVQRVKENGGYIREWLADAAYMAAYNVEAVEKVGGTPYIDFPSRTRGAGSPVIRRLYNKFQADQDEYYRHYHQRSLAESGMNMIKTRFSHHLRSRVPNAMYAEAMLRCICHNIAMLVHAIGELGVEPRYYTAESSETLVATPAPKPAPASVTVEGAASP